MIFHQPHNSLSNYNYNVAFYTDKIWDFHFHRNLELIYVINGAVNCTVNNIHYRLSASEFGLCLPYDIHRYEPEKDTLYWVLVFSEDYIRYLAKQFSGKKGDGFKFRCKSSIENYMKEQLVNDAVPSTLTLKSCLYAVCEEYLNHIKLLNKDHQETKIIPLIADYIHANHTKKLTLSDIAKKLGYDYNYMSRFFRNTFNITFTDFVNIYRLETAIKLLEETDESILSVAYESGFQSVRSFNNFFKNKMKISPSEYRKASR